MLRFYILFIEFQNDLYFRILLKHDLHKSIFILKAKRVASL